MEYYINYNTGAGNEYFNGTLAEAKAAADHKRMGTGRPPELVRGKIRSRIIRKRRRIGRDPVWRFWPLWRMVRLLSL